MPTVTRLQQLARCHIRLLLSLFVGIALFFLLPEGWSQLARVLVGWNSGVMLFLVLAWTWATRLSHAQLVARYEEEDEANWVILILVTASALFSLIAIIVFLATIRQASVAVQNAHFLLAAITVTDSWVLVPTIFALHYADLFYSARPDRRPLLFPGTPLPAFWDFAYFSFTIAAACQTADVATNNVTIRKAVIAQTILSFIFNISILGFAINVSAGLLAGP